MLHAAEEGEERITPNLGNTDDMLSVVVSDPQSHV